MFGDPGALYHAVERTCGVRTLINLNSNDFVSGVNTLTFQ